MAQKPLRPMPKKAPLPRYRPPDGLTPRPDNPSWELDQPVEGEPTARGEYFKQQQFMAPSKRDRPIFNFTKGGKVISTRTK